MAFTPCCRHYSFPSTPVNSEYAWQFFDKLKVYPSHLQCPYKVCHLQSYHPWQIADYIEKNSQTRYSPHIIPGKALPCPMTDEQNQACGRVSNMFYLHTTSTPPIYDLGTPIDTLNNKPYRTL